jgi:hypothetical protein
MRKLLMITTAGVVAVIQATSALGITRYEGSNPAPAATPRERHCTYPPATHEEYWRGYNPALDRSGRFRASIQEIEQDAERRCREQEVQYEQRKKEERAQWEARKEAEARSREESRRKSEEERIRKEQLAQQAAEAERIKNKEEIAKVRWWILKGVDGNTPVGDMFSPTTDLSRVKCLKDPKSPSPASMVEDSKGLGRLVDKGEEVDVVIDPKEFKNRLGNGLREQFGGPGGAFLPPGTAYKISVAASQIAALIPNGLTVRYLKTEEGCQAALGLIRERIKSEERAKREAKEAEDRKVDKYR